MAIWRLTGGSTVQNAPRTPRLVHTAWSATFVLPHSSPISIVPVPVGHLLAFALAAAVIIVVPGPSVMFIVGRALAIDKRAALLSVLGNTIGEYLQVIAVAIGIGVLVERSVVAFEAIKLAGAAYLVWLGFTTWRRRGDLGLALSAGATAAPARSWRIASQGFVVGVSNPKTVIFLSAILPQFVDKTSGHEPLQILALGAVFSCIALVSDSLWALGAGRFREWFARSPRRLRLVGGTGGLAIMAVGVGLAVTGRKD
jgi:threonine/homoserine/homoserine lactone efflux protein